MFDNLVASIISSYIYYYDDRVSFALAFNVRNRAEIGLIEKSMTDDEMTMAVAFDNHLMVRYHHLRGEYPKNMDVLMNSISCMHRYSWYFRGVFESYMDNIILITHDRFGGIKALEKYVPRYARRSNHPLAIYHFGYNGFRDIENSDLYSGIKSSFIGYKFIGPMKEDEEDEDYRFMFSHSRLEEFMNQLPPSEYLAISGSLEKMYAIPSRVNNVGRVVESFCEVGRIDITKPIIRKYPECMETIDKNISDYIISECYHCL